MSKKDYMTGATMWFQNAGEVIALQEQAYNFARVRLDDDLQRKHRKPRAIIVDADETIVDNSPYQAYNILNERDYSSSSWQEWVQMKKAKAIPGSVEFLKYADSKGVKVFYVTNRKIKGFDATLANLKALGFPITKDRLLLRTKSSSKKERRQSVMKDHHVVLLMGDALGDFADEFEHKTVEARNQQVRKMKAEFGKRFIVLPNPTYGEWEMSIYQYKYKADLKAKDKMRKDSLNSF
jgi:5'-nucleotidase (lipoprotein e(P4) family)